MHPETLFTASKWDILTLLADGPKSPLELARLTRTSMANVSQQIRLLEFAGLVSGSRIPNREKEKPRILYALARSQVYIIATGPGFVHKGFVKLDPSAHLLTQALLSTGTRRSLLLQLLPALDGLLEQCHAIYLRATPTTADLLLVSAAPITPPPPRSLRVHGASVDVRFQLGSPEDAGEGWTLLCAQPAVKRS